jgi:hypothetical protein
MRRFFLATPLSCSLLFAALPLGAQAKPARTPNQSAVVYAQAEISVSGQTLRLGMPRDSVFGALSYYHFSENSSWSAANKPYSLWTVTGEQIINGKTVQMNGKPLQVIKGALKFKGDKLDGVSWEWTPETDESSDFAANVINLLETFSKEGATHCELTTETKSTPHQEQRVAILQCGLRSVIVEHSRFQGTLPSGQKYPDSASLSEQLNF